MASCTATCHRGADPYVSDWPFDDPPNVATFTVRQIMKDGLPILFVRRDDDGWQFLTGSAVTMRDAMLVGLKEIVSRDPSVADLADLDVGWQAWRERAGAPWVREPSPEEGAAEQ